MSYEKMLKKDLINEIKLKENKVKDLEKELLISETCSKKFASHVKALQADNDAFQRTLKVYRIIIGVLCVFSLIVLWV